MCKKLVTESVSSVIDLWKLRREALKSVSIESKNSDISSKREIREEQQPGFAPAGDATEKAGKVSEEAGKVSEEAGTVSEKAGDVSYENAPEEISDSRRPADTELQQAGQKKHVIDQGTVCLVFVVWCWNSFYERLIKYEIVYLSTLSPLCLRLSKPSLNLYYSHEIL